MKQSSKLNALLAAAQKEAENIKDIKSVADQGLAPAEAPVPSVEGHTATNDIDLGEHPAKQRMPLKEVPRRSEKSFEDFLLKTDIRDTEIIRIPRELHKNLKTLSAASGSSMTQIMGNILSEFFDIYQKEILAYKKKMF